MTDKRAEPGERGSGRIESTGRFSAQNTIGHRGRPKDSITNALRRQVDPEQIASFLLGVIADPKASSKDRLRACELVQDRLEGRAVARSITVRQTASAILPVGYFELSRAARERVLDDVRQRALSGDLHNLDNGETSENED